MEKIRDPLPVVVGADLSSFSNRQILPVVLELKGRVSHSAASGNLGISPYGDHGPVMSDYRNPYLGSLFDVTHDGVKSPVAVGAFSQHDVFGIHSYGFENKSGLVAIVFHRLELIKTPRAIARHGAHLCGEMPDPVAQVVFQVRLARHIGPGTSGDTVVVRSDVHQTVLFWEARRRRCSGARDGDAGRDRAADKFLTELSSLHNKTAP